MFNFIATLISLLLPALIDCCLIQINYKKAKKGCLFISLILYFIVIIEIFRCGFTEPGLIPNHELYTYLINQINQKMKLSDQEQCDYQIINNPIYQMLSQQCESSINIIQKDITHRSCITCKTYKPARSSHSSRSNMCTMRMDHYCPWIGSDIGIRNLWLFYKMVLSILIYIIIILVIQLTYLGFNVQNILNERKTMLWVELGCHALIICADIYFIYSISTLINYHINLLKTGTLTKEYIGSQALNLQASGQFDLGSIKNNFNLAKYLYTSFKDDTLMSQFYRYQEYLLNIIETNNIHNWNDLQQYIIDNSDIKDLYILELHNFCNVAFQYLSNKYQWKIKEFQYDYQFLVNSQNNQAYQQYDKQLQKYIEKLQKQLKEVNQIEDPYTIRYKQVEYQRNCYMILYQYIDKQTKFKQVSADNQQQQNQQIFNYYLLSPLVTSFAAMSIMIKQITRDQNDVNQKIQQLQNLPPPDLCRCCTQSNKQQKQIELKPMQQETINTQEINQQTNHVRRQGFVQGSPLDIENIISE